MLMGGVACVLSAAVRKASCLAESGVVQPGLHTRYVGTCGAAPVSLSLRGGGGGSRWGRPSLLFDGRCLGAPGCTRVSCSGGVSRVSGAVRRRALCVCVPLSLPFSLPRGVMVRGEAWAAASPYRGRGQI